MTHTTTIPTKYLIVRGTLLQESEKAIRFSVESIDEEALEVTQTAWFPFSQIKSLNIDITTTGADYFQCPEWLLDSKGLV